MKHPRHDLSFVCSRRKFWQALLQEILVVHGSLQGGQGCRLFELGSLPDDQLAQIRPIVNQDCEIFVNQDHVWSQFKETDTTLKLFPLKQENLVVFNLFNGRHELGEIGERLSQEMGWGKIRAFAHARDLFLSLVRYMVCVPQNPPEPDE